MDVTTALGVIQREIMGRCGERNQLPCAQSAKLEFCMYTSGMKFSLREAAGPQMLLRDPWSTEPEHISIFYYRCNNYFNFFIY